MIFTPSTTIISDNRTLVRFEVRRRKWLLPPLVRNKTPDPLRRNRLVVALWDFNLVFPAFNFLGTAKLLYKKLSDLVPNRSPNNWTVRRPCNQASAAGVSLAATGATFFVLVNLVGVSIMVITFPSRFGTCSIDETSASSSAISFKSSRASSG